MPSPLFVGGVLVLGSVGAYELYEKIIKPKLDAAPASDSAKALSPAGSPAPAVSPAAATPNAPAAGAPAPPDFTRAPRTVAPSERARLLAAHPQWGGWHPGTPAPLPGKPSPPALRAAAVSAATTTPIVGGKPVMSGVLAKDLAALLAWHGVSPADKGFVQRFQQSVGLQPDGIIGPKTMAALATSLQALGIPMPHIVPAAGHAPRGPARPAAPDGDALAK